ncbi:Choline/ethanolaminephosphotransferase 1 [Cyberlindnera fabianii]|uniref:Choline/ethanolaminephosphotransferase 1 n=1 Tax=Cyberlindnera fabianii TaxID=36022 RepID=A0A1V2L997_CYBFA|nr:Choline/ethanolaminephosphotransferase 1 [Cyberlindnera fabianii]
MDEPINANPTVLDERALPTRGDDKSTDQTLNSQLEQLLSLSINYKSQSPAPGSPGLMSDHGSDEDTDDDEEEDPIDSQEIFDLIAHITDPEHPVTLGQLSVVNLEDIKVIDSRNKNEMAEVIIKITPTITHCSLATLIGLGIRLFDHCVDAINTTLSTIIFASVTGFGYSWILVISQFGTLANFYLSTWEEYHTHKLFLSEFSGPVEGILGVVGMFILTGITGPEIWKKELLTLDLSFIKLDPNFIVTPVTIFIVFGSLGLYFNIESARRNVSDYYKSTNQTSKIIDAYKGILPFFVYYATVFAWLWFNPLIIEKHLLPFILTVGLTIAFAVGRIIIGHLTKQSFPYTTPSSFIPVAEFLLFMLFTKLGYSSDVITGELVWAGFGLSLGLHAMFITEIIFEITTYLDIWALTIKHPKLD